MKIRGQKKHKIISKIIALVVIQAVVFAGLPGVYAGDVLWTQSSSVSPETLAPGINLSNKTIQMTFLSVDTAVAGHSLPLVDKVQKQKIGWREAFSITGVFLVIGNLIFSAFGFLTGCHAVLPQAQVFNFNNRIAEHRVVDIEYEHMRNYVEQFLFLTLSEGEHKRIKRVRFGDVIFNPRFSQFVQNLRDNEYDLEGFESHAVLKLARIFNNWQNRELVFSKGFREFGQFLQNAYGINVLDDFKRYIKIYYDPITLGQYKDEENVDTFKKIEKQFGKLKGAFWRVESLQTIRVMEDWEEKFRAAKLFNVLLRQQYSGLEEVTSVEQVLDLINLGNNKALKDILLSKKAKKIYQEVRIIWHGFSMDTSRDYGFNANLKRFAEFVQAFQGELEDLTCLKDFGITLNLDSLNFSSEIDMRWLLSALQRPEFKIFYKNFKQQNPRFNFGNSLIELSDFVRFALHPRRDEFLKLYARVEAREISVFDPSNFVEILEKGGIETLRILVEDYPKISYNENNDRYLLLMASVKDDLLSARVKNAYHILIDNYKLESLPFRDGFIKKIKENPDFLAVIQNNDFHAKYNTLRKHYGLKNDFDVIAAVYEMHENNKTGIDALLSKEGLRVFKLFSGMSHDKIYYFYLDKFSEFIQRDGAEVLELLRVAYGFNIENSRVSFFECEKLVEDKKFREQLKTKKMQEFFRTVTQDGLIACSNMEDLEAIAELSEIENAQIILSVLKRLGFDGITFWLDDFMRLAEQKDALQNLTDPGFESFYEKCKPYLTLDTDLKDLRYVCALYTRISAADNSEALFKLMFSDIYKEVIEMIKRDYHLNFITGDMLSNLLELGRGFDKEKIDRLKQYIPGEISANDLILLHEVSKDPELLELFQNRELLLAYAEKIYERTPPVVRTVGGDSQKKGYTERPDVSKLDNAALMRLYLLDKLLDVPEGIAVLTSIVKRDLEDMTTEYGGTIILKNGKLHFKNIKSISEDNGSYGIEINMFFNGGTETFHLHAIRPDASEYAGPSEPDWEYVGAYNNIDVVITTCGFDNSGRLKVNVDMYYIDHNGERIDIDTRTVILPLRKEDLKNSVFKNGFLNKSGTPEIHMAPIGESPQGLSIESEAVLQSV